MRMMSGGLGPAAAMAALFLVSTGYAQDAVPAPSGAAADAPAATAPAPASTGGASDAAAATAQGKPADPHALLDDLSGGPQGSPTAQRGNPQPGTSTSIPTTNPATVRPVEQERAGNSDISVEDTGFEGQCDPVVSIGCPGVADQLQTGTPSVSANGVAGAAQPAPERTAEPAQAGN